MTMQRTRDARKVMELVDDYGDAREVRGANNEGDNVEPAWKKVREELDAALRRAYQAGKESML